MGEPLQNENISSTRIEQLQRTYDLYEQIYFNSISSLETLNISRVQTAKYRQVEPASVPNRTLFASTNSNRFGWCCELTGTAGIAFLVEYLDDTIKTPEDVEILGLPVIGFVSSMNLKEIMEEKKGSYVANHPRSPITEAFELLEQPWNSTVLINPSEHSWLPVRVPKKAKQLWSQTWRLSMLEVTKKYSCLMQICAVQMFIYNWICPIASVYQISSGGGSNHQKLSIINPRAFKIWM